jgi:hypothetical protein
MREIEPEGLVFTIEPMIAARPPRLVTGSDDWTIRDLSGTLSAH